MITAPSITEAGKELLSRSVGGEQITFTRFAIGNGEKPANPEKLTDIVNKTMDFGITSCDKSKSGYVRITGKFGSEDVENDFRWTELGLFCKGEDGKEKLYAYANDGENGTIVKAGKDKSIDVSAENTVSVLIAIGDAQQVTAITVSSVVYASKASLDAHIADKGNPHSVTAAQVGLGNVPNVTTNNQTPTYDTPDAVEALTSGEKLSAAFGKIKAAVAALISHLANKDNPHAVTPGKIGAAEKYHLHSAADINSGILGVARGGTGASTYAQLMENLRTASASYVCGTHTGDGAAQITVGLPFTPSVVWWYPLDGIAADGNYAALAVGKPDGTGAGGQANLSGTTYGPYTQGSGTMLFLSTNGFRVYYDATKKIYTNKDGKKYGYVAIR